VQPHQFQATSSHQQTSNQPMGQGQSSGGGGVQRPANVRNDPVWSQMSVEQVRDQLEAWERFKKYQEWEASQKEERDNKGGW